MEDDDYGNANSNGSMEICCFVGCDCSSSGGKSFTFLKDRSELLELNALCKFSIGTAALQTRAINHTPEFFEPHPHRPKAYQGLQTICSAAATWHIDDCNKHI